MNLISVKTRALENLTDNCTLKITRIGQEFCSPQKKPEKIKRNYYSLHFVLFGSGTLKYGDAVHRVKAGRAFLLYEGIEYEYYPDPKNPWTYVWVDILGENLDSFFSQVGFSRENPVIKINKMNEFNPLLRDLHDAYSHNLYGEMAYYGYFFLIYDRLIDNSLTYPVVTKTKVLNKKLIRDILIYMNNNSRLNLTPREIGKKFNISYGTLMGLFKSEVGMAPMEYLLHFRVSHACVLLRAPDRASIGEIANAVGYADQLYFARIFKKIMGMTPTEYSKAESVDDPYEWLKAKDLDFR